MLDSSGGMALSGPCLFFRLGLSFTPTLFFIHPPRRPYLDPISVSDYYAPPEVFSVSFSTASAWTISG